VSSAPALSRTQVRNSGWVLFEQGEDALLLMIELVPETGRVTAQPGMDGPHEAEVGRAVVLAGLRSPPASNNG
jgi:hypothetical protein